MYVSIVLLFFIVVLGILLNDGASQNNSKRKTYIIIIISLLILESCLRSISVGPDTREYFYKFNAVNSQSWQEIFSSFRAAYIEGEGKDVGYLVFVKLFQYISSDFNVFLFVCGLVFFIPLGLVLYRYSNRVMQLMFAFTLYIALFHIIALSGVRQQIATGFSFMALLQLQKKRYFSMLLLIIIGASIHISLLIFLSIPFIVIVIPQLVKSIHLFSFATIPFGITYSGPIMLFLASFLAFDYYTSYGSSIASGGAFTYITLMELLSFFCYIAIKKENILKDDETTVLYSMLPMITMTVPLISLDGAMIRVGQYFTLYMMLLVPRAIDIRFKGSSRKVVYYVLIATLLFLTLNNYHSNYLFFWQEPQI